MRRAHLPFSLPRSLTAQIKYASPNVHELHAIAAAFGVDSALPSSTDVGRIAAIAASVQRHIDTVLVTMGSLGVLVASSNNDDPQQAAGCAVVRFYAAPTIATIVNVSGAGDSFASGFVAAQIAGRPEAVCVSVGFASAAAALQSRGAVAERYDAVGAACDWTIAAHFETIPVS